MNISWQQLQKDTQKLVKLLKEDGRQLDTIVAITRGGLVPAAIIAHELGIKMIETICISSYDDEIKQARELEILKRYTNEENTVLVVDDLVDSGTTFDVILSMLPNACRACLYAKPNGKASVDIYAIDVQQETWIVFPWEESQE